MMVDLSEMGVATSQGTALEENLKTWFKG